MAPANTPDMAPVMAQLSAFSAYQSAHLKTKLYRNEL